MTRNGLTITIWGVSVTAIYEMLDKILPDYNPNPKVLKKIYIGLFVLFVIMISLSFLGKAINGYFFGLAVVSYLIMPYVVGELAMLNDHSGSSPYMHIFFQMDDGSYVAFWEVPKSPPFWFLASSIVFPLGLFFLFVPYRTES